MSELRSRYLIGPVLIHKALIERANDRNIDIVIGYGERTTDDHYYNTCAYIHAGREVSKYRKIHLPGNREPYADAAMIDQLEKRYFEPGNLGYRVSSDQGRREPKLT